MRLDVQFIRSLTLATLCVVCLLPAARAAEILVRTGDSWRFLRGLAEASTPDTTAWRQSGFNDSGWESRPATFFYGEPGFSGTELTGMQNGYNSFFLRRTFELTGVDALTNLTLRAICDDGFVAWINGQILVAHNAPTGPITFDSLAGANAIDPPIWFDFLVPESTPLLQDGTNILAVQVFNVSRGSSDAVFDAELTVDYKPDAPLRIVLVQPDPGIISNLTSIQVQFGEPVTGVDASDLLLNGTSPVSVTGANDTYQFEVTQPPYGTIQISWAPNNGIQTISAPIRPLLPDAPGANWRYELVDVLSPQMVRTHPQAGAVVRRLAEVEIWFSQPVTGVDPSDLLVNGQPATNLYGIGAGPFRFSFPDVTGADATFDWKSDHGIESDSPLPRPFSGSSWMCRVDPDLPLPVLRINEFLAENLSGLRDEDQDVESWIELHNQDAQPVNLEGWSLTDESDQPGQWIFPPVTIPAGGYLVVFASGKDRTPVPGSLPLHTNFKLSPRGEYLGLFSPDAPRAVVDQILPAYPEQRPDHSYGRLQDGTWRYFRPSTPSAPNGNSTIAAQVGEVHFSAGRGFYHNPLYLTLTTATPGSVIRYTLNGALPTASNGVVYLEPFLVDRTRIVRAAAFKRDHVPSRVQTHTYLYGLPANRRLLPALSLVTATNNLYGPTGIMETNPRNTTRHGILWERPVSVELMRPEDNGGFALDCGIRVAGGDYIRGLYNYRTTSFPEGKYSFRIYFRGDYGEGRLQYPWFPDTTLDSFDKVTLRAGMNDPSNPFLRDEVVRQLTGDTGQVAAHGTFVNLFLNGVYKGYYNPTERIDDEFLTDYHGGGGQWDVVAQNLEVHQGNAQAWNSLRSFINLSDLTNSANYLALGRRLDLANFVDYLLVNAYADTDDWPHNNWRAARERVPEGLFRFYSWDAEWALGYNNSFNHNTIANQMSSTSPPWGSTEVQTMFNKIKRVPEFKLLFADRVHKHLFNGGALADERIRARYERVRNAIAPSIAGFNDSIGTSWIPNRRRYLLLHLAAAGFLASSNAPAFNPFGGSIPAGFELTLSAPLAGVVYYTTNGSDPREMFTGNFAPDAVPYTAPLSVHQSMVIRARTFNAGQWSALSEASFQVGTLGGQIEITEIMYNPPGGGAFEFIELRNLALFPVNLQDHTFSGITYRFPVGSPSIGPGQSIVLASTTDPAAFATRYPNVTVSGYFTGSLDNAGESVALLDPTGQILTSVTYDDDPPWPPEADGQGASLERIDPRAGADDPANWRASTIPGGTPGSDAEPEPLPPVRLNEVMALNLSSVPQSGAFPDWIELHNTGPASVSISGWGISDQSGAPRFVFPAGTSLEPGAYLMLWCDNLTNSPGLHTGFGLDAQGETLALFDATAKRIDALSFGPQVADRTIGRVGDDTRWALCDPTPGAPNEPAQVGSTVSLTVNEILADPLPGEDDWVEIHNRDAQSPVSLLGVYVGTSNALHQIRSLSFVPPAGFVLLHADLQPGPDHLNLEFPGASGVVTLADPTGAEIDRFTYGTQYEQTTYGRYPDGASSKSYFPNSPSPGASNYIAGLPGPLLNEFMARNQTALPDTTLRIADWVEIVNPTAGPIDLAGFSLQSGSSDSRRWPIPLGTTLNPGAHLLLWCDPTLPPSTNSAAPLNSGFGLPAEGGSLRLLDRRGLALDSVGFGFQLEGRSVGRDGLGWRLLSTPTPGSPNSAAAPLGNPALLRINEWMAGPASGPDWFEIYNPDIAPVDMGGMFLTDDPSSSGLSNSLVGPLTFVPPAGFVRWIADGDRDAGPDHTDFSLAALGETLRLYSPARLVVESVVFTAQQTGASEGRWPDGADQFVRFVETPSPEESNYLPIKSVILNEILTHTDSPREDAIELRNIAPAQVDISGWFLSDSSHNLKKYRFPDQTILAPGAFHVVYEYQFNPQPGSTGSFSLNSAQGDSVWLSEADTQGQLSGRRSLATFGAAFNAIPFGRIQTSLGVDWFPLQSPTFGRTAPVSLDDFRQGSGATNTPPRIGPVVITEIHFHPATAPPEVTLDEEDLEFVEIHNQSDSTVFLHHPTHATNRWILDGGIEFVFPPGFSLLAGKSVVVVGFNPASDPARLDAFRSHFSLDASVPILGPFDGRLANEGELLELLQPDNPQGASQPDAGFVPYMVTDRVRYASAGAWPNADGNGRSLQRRNPALYGNEPLHWLSATPSPGTVDLSPLDLDADQDGLPDAWESDHGLSSLDPTDADLDPDLDGFTSRQEFMLGTHPNDPASLLRLDLDATQSDLILSFVAAGDRSYTVEYTDDPASGQWFSLADIPTDPSARQVQVNLERLGQPHPRYFRVVSPGRF